MSIEGSGASRAGGDGLHNEDAFLVEDGLGLYVVCDGASDTSAGEVAARVAADAIEKFIERSETELDLADGSVARLVVEEAMTRALRAVHEAEAVSLESGPLETTVSMLLAHGEVGVIGHHGDSRIYLIRRDRGHQLTQDHALTNTIPGAQETSASFDVFAVALEPRDTLVLCTDGAERVLEDATIVRAAADLSPALLASRIVSAANRSTPEADSTAVVVRVRGDREAGWLALSEEPERTAFGHTLERGGSRRE